MVIIPMQTFTLPESQALDILGWMTLIFWTVELFSNFFVGFYREGVLVTAPPSIAWRYLTTWLPLDMSIVGLDWIFYSIEASSGGSGSMRGYVRIFRVLRILRVVRLLRLLKLRRLMQNIEDVMDTEKVSIYWSFMKPILTCIIINHFIACLLYKVTDLGLSKSILKEYELQKRSLGYRYFTCFHWALSHFTVGNMDIAAQNTPERLYTVVVFIIGLSMFSTLIGNVASSVDQLRQLHTDETRQFWLLRRYLKDYGVSKGLTIRIHRYCDYAYKNRKTRVDDQKVRDIIPSRNAPGCSGVA
jgi:hypothetical protein